MPGKCLSTFRPGWAIGSTRPAQALKTGEPVFKYSLFYRKNEIPTDDQMELRDVYPKFEVSLSAKKEERRNGNM
jgi:hypothetical protein